MWFLCVDLGIKDLKKKKKKEEEKTNSAMEPKKREKKVYDLPGQKRDTPDEVLLFYFFLLCEERVLF